MNYSMNYGNIKISSFNGVSRSDIVGLPANNTKKENKIMESTINSAMKDSVGVTGELNIVLRDKFGNIKENIDVKNLVVTVGKQYIASRIAGVTGTSGAMPGVMSHMALGTNNTAPDAGQTGLLAEITTGGGGRAAMDSTTTTGQTITYTATFASGVGTGAVTEAGIFGPAASAPNSGTMLSRTTFQVVNKAVDDSLTITWAITVN